MNPAILALALPFARELIVAWMQNQGKESVSLDELKAFGNDPAVTLAEMGIDMETGEIKAP